jgi:hypothetical protein
MKCWVQAGRTMAKFVWAVRVLSPRDGGWVRMFGHFWSEVQAWIFVALFRDMLVETGDYFAVEVVLTIKFK